MYNETAEKRTTRKLQFSEQQNVPRGTLERSLGTLHVGSLHFIEMQDRIIYNHHSSGALKARTVI